MTDQAKILAFVETCSDAEKLRQLIVNARSRSDAKHVADAAFRRLIALVPDEEPGSLEHDFWQTIHAFEEILGEERGRTTRLTRTRQKLARVGIVETLRGFAEGAPTPGFHMLVERGMPELLGEALIVRHASRFEPATVAAAQNRLFSIGYTGQSSDLGALPPPV